MRPAGKRNISLAGWPLRRFDLRQLESLLTQSRPSLVEISKDLIRDTISLKDLARALERIGVLSSARVAYAGTTNLTTCAGFSWPRYRSYVAVQIAQAKWLECSFFRLLIGDGGQETSLSEIVGRIQDVCDDLLPIECCIEIHGGVESDLSLLPELLRSAPVKIVIDVENVQRAGLTAAALTKVLPSDRIAYFHQRNLPPQWIEQESLLEAESHWHTMMPAADFLWEPKTVDDPQRIQELFLEYRKAH